MNTAVFLEEAARISKSCTSPLVLLKGASLFPDVYQDYGQRTFSDIDFLIKKEDLSILSELLMSMGYQLIEEKRWAGNNFKWNFKKQSEEGLTLIIELHSHLFMSLDENWDWQTEPIDGQLYRLKAEDLLVHLCGHLVYQHNFLKLFWLLDIYEFLKKKDDLDWERVFTISQSLKLTKSVAMTLVALKRLTELDLPESKKIFSPSPVYHQLLTPEFLLAPRSSPIRYYVLKHLKTESLKEAIIYDIKNVSHRLRRP